MIDRTELFARLDGARKDMIELQRLLTSVPAIAPESDGDGEKLKAEALTGWLKKRGFDPVENYPARDERAAGGERPNLVVRLPGRDSARSFWIMSHLDIVPPGDLSKWESDPYTLVERDGRIYGRGVEDNQQGMVSSIFALLALRDGGIVPPYKVNLLFAADEEFGSTYGIGAVLRDHPDLFGKNDTFLVPDGGRPDGTMIEIAEKSVLWLRFSVTGKQVHASMPQLGKNAFVAGSDLVVRLAKGLEKIFSRQDPIFDPPYSTFCPTKKEANVPNVNTIPGLDVFCLDCRILPSEDVDSVLAEIDGISRGVESDYGVTVERSILQRKSSVSTSPDCALVRSLKRSVAKIHGTEGRVTGIGGGTVGAFLRNAGYDTVVWSTLDETAHMPNEYCVVDYMIKDAKVMLDLMLAED
jgi:succinyl-diaminopimelate desuccinylase